MSKNFPDITMNFVPQTGRVQVISRSGKNGAIHGTDVLLPSVNNSKGF